MTDQEIVRHLAERIMRWHIADSIFDPVYPKLLNRYDGRFVLHETDRKCRLWNPLESIADASEVQAALPEDLRAAYLGHLECICVRGGFDDDNPAHVWALVAATARQRCLAAVEVTR